MKRSRLFCGVARERLRIDAVGAQHVLEPLRHALGVHEHHRAVGIGLAQQAQQQGDLLLHRRVVDDLAHAIGGDLLGLDAHQLGAVHVLMGELEHALRERRREQHRLAVLRRRQAAQDVADVGDEAEVEHAVRLVERRDLGVAQVEHVLLVVVDDAARRADQHVDPVLELAALLVIVDAASTTASRRPVCRPSSSASLWIWTASSRVGAMTMARTPVLLRAAGEGRVSRFWKIEIRNAAVLPVPVCAWPATSRPARAKGSVWAWIGVQRSKPASAIPCMTAGVRSRAEGEVGKVLVGH
ncbi:MAG: hypothetical protein U1F11_05090 [Steroidobacteraceae bacterium]